MSTFDEKVCLKVQRAGITEIFRLRGAVVKFGYAPGGEHDLVLHDSRLEDVQGVIERKDESAEPGFTPYHLKASSSGVEVEGVRLPPVSYTHLDVYKRQCRRRGDRRSRACP